MQGHVLGFGVSGLDHQGWFRPVFHDRAGWLSGGEFGPEASVFGIVADLVVIGLLWRWKGLSAAQPGDARVPPSAQAPVVGTSAT